MYCIQYLILFCVFFFLFFSFFSCIVFLVLVFSFFLRKDFIYGFWMVFPVCVDAMWQVWGHERCFYWTARPFPCACRKKWSYWWLPSQIWKRSSLWTVFLMFLKQAAESEVENGQKWFIDVPLVTTVVYRHAVTCSRGRETIFWWADRGAQPLKPCSKTAEASDGNVSNHRPLP